MADLATSEIHLYDLPTKTVNLNPTGATVVREIHTKIQVSVDLCCYTRVHILKHC